MATIISGDRFEVFKFHSTGLIPLFYEVVDLIRDNPAYIKGVLIDTARYEFRDGMHVIVFDVDTDVRYGRTS